VGAFIGPRLLESAGIGATAWTASATNVVALMVLLALVVEHHEDTIDAI
jgi:predicted MFS family arabinose efflux permease